jgi:pyruvate/2-oxoacid:ferredoxin oxidoreductase alpha subunit
MLKQTEGSHAVAEAIALCRPQVICAYPITPQTHIVEGLGEHPDLGALAARSAALCTKRPLYPGFRGFTTYVA